MTDVTDVTDVTDAAPAAGRPRGRHQGPAVGRRALLAVAAGGTLALAACGSGGSGSSASGSSGSGSSGSPGSSGSSSASGSSGSSAAATTTVVALADVPVGGAVAAKLGGKPIVVAQPTAGTVKAFSAICTHQGCTVAVKGAKLDCPCHGSVFDALTGAVEKGPATVDLPAVAVSVSGADVVAS